MNKEIVLQVRDICQSFGKGEARIDVLNKVNFSIKAGEIVALMGPSGMGKSTLLHIMGMLEKQKCGEILLNGEETFYKSDAKKTYLRRENMGFVYQFHHLQGEFSAIENVMLPQLLAGKKKKPAKEKAKELLTMVGLDHRLNHRPAKLSGGEQQRVSIARALANDPKILLADEPTGNLDKDTSNQVFDLLLGIVKEKNMSCLFATHNEKLAKKANRILQLDKIQEEI